MAVTLQQTRPQHHCKAEVSTLLAKQTSHGVAQHLLKFTPSQKATLFALRRDHIAGLARISLRRQQLLQQLQHSHEAVGSDGLELAASHNTICDITQQLQRCVTKETEQFIRIKGGVASGVSPVLPFSV